MNNSYEPPKTHYDAVVLSLKLAITAPNLKISNEAKEMTKHLSVCLTNDEKERAKTEVDFWSQDATEAEKLQYRNIRFTREEIN